MNKHAQEYLEKGWSAPLPLPKGEKFPPPTGATGNIPELTQTQIEEYWSKAGRSPNLGLRLQSAGEYEIISLDVDHYGSKVGDDFLTEMEEELGSLNREEIPRSTRRGVKSPSAQYFFRVPKGMKWKSSACSDVDVVQMTHRYAAVWPSKVDDTQYTWYLGDEEIDVPHVNDIPLLPERWVSFLKKSKIGKLAGGEGRISTKADTGYREAVNWLRQNIPGWDISESEAMSQSLRKVSDSDEYRDALAGNGHDSMVSAIHAAVMLGVEGHQGLKAALQKVRDNFIREITTSSRRSEKAALAEYQTALIGEVNRLIEEVSDGSVVVADFGTNLALPNFSELLVREEADKRPRDVDLSLYSDTDLGHAEMMRDYWDKDLLTVAGGDSSQEFVAWVPKTARFEFRDKRATFQHMSPAISDRIHFEAEKIAMEAEALEGISEERQLDEDERDPDELKAIANKLIQRANRTRNTNQRKAILEAMHGFSEHRIHIDELDSSPNLIGLPGGEVLDLDDLRIGADYIRKGRQQDLLTKTTSVRLVPDAESEAWNKFLDDFVPDKEMRDFVQKVIGYTLVSGNPEKKLIFLFGPSNTGKTTILEAVGKALGDYAGPMNAIRLFGANSGGPSPEMVDNLGKRMVFMSEVGDDHQLSANSVKRVTGNDTQATRQLHSNVMRNAAPKFTPYVSTNSVPEIRGVDAATRERILVIPFNEVHPRKRVTEENDLQNPKNLTAILWWIVEGCRRYFEEGLDPEDWPDEVKAASGTFSTDTAPLQSFLEETLVATDDKKDRIPIHDLFQTWENYCLKNRIDKKDIGSVDDFRKKVEGNGWTVDRGTINGKRNQRFVRFAKISA